jgi:hypothetical protein
MTPSHSCSLLPFIYSRIVTTNTTQQQLLIGVLICCRIVHSGYGGAGRLYTRDHVYEPEYYYPGRFPLTRICIQTRSETLGTLNYGFLSLSLRLMLRPTVSRPVCLGIKHPFGAYNQIFYYLCDSYGLVLVGRPLWREVGSVFCMCQRSLSRVQVPWDSRPYFTVSDLRLPFSSPPTTRRVTVEVFDPTSTRVVYYGVLQYRSGYKCVEGTAASISNVEIIREL